MPPSADITLTREQMEELEWSASSYPQDSLCPICYAEKPVHEPHCWLGKLLHGDANAVAETTPLPDNRKNDAT